MNCFGGNDDDDDDGSRAHCDLEPVCSIRWPRNKGMASPGSTVTDFRALATRIGIESVRALLSICAIVRNIACDVHSNMSGLWLNDWNIY